MKTLAQTSPIGAAFWVFVIIYLTAVLYVRHITYLDPGSLFFNPKLAYTRKYSEVRRQQANRYITTATSPTFPSLLRKPSSAPDLCVGVAGLLEGPARYLETNIGSLLEGLTNSERDRIHLSAFLVHWQDPAPTSIPDHFKPWMHKLVDDVQLYKLSNLTTDGLLALKDARPYYTDLMKSCYGSGASYMAIFEDETVAMDGWFHRTLEAIDQAEALSSNHNFKINLFYPEAYLPKWHPEHTLNTYLISSTTVMVAFAAALFTIRLLSSRLKPHLTTRVILTVSCICIPAIVILAISARGSIYQTLPKGLNRLNIHPGNSQGYVYPRQFAREIIEWNHDNHALGASEVIEGRGNDLVWTLNPSVVQHVGRHSLKGDYFSAANEEDRVVAEELFNFAFELNDAEELKKEHFKMTGQEPG